MEGTKSSCGGPASEEEERKRQAAEWKEAGLVYYIQSVKEGIKNGGAHGQRVKDLNARKRGRMEADETGELTPPNQQCESERRERSRSTTRQDMENLKYVAEHDGELTSEPGEELGKGTDTSAEKEEEKLEEAAEQRVGKEGEEPDVYDFAKPTEDEIKVWTDCDPEGEFEDEEQIADYEEFSRAIDDLNADDELSDKELSAGQHEQSTTRMMEMQEPVLVLGEDEQRHTKFGNDVTVGNLREEINSGAANTTSHLRPDISMQSLRDWVQSILPFKNSKLRYLSIAQLAKGSTGSSRFDQLVTHGILTFKQQLIKRKSTTPFVLCKLSTPDFEHTVTFCIFARKAMMIIQGALLGSTIGVGHFHEFKERMGYSLSYCVSDTAGMVTVLQTEQQTTGSGGGVGSGRRITVLRLCGGAPACGAPGGEGRGGSGPRRGGSGGGGATAASQQQHRGEGGASAASQQKQDFPKKRGRPPKASAAQPLQQQLLPRGKGRPKKGKPCAEKPTSTQTSPTVGFVHWHATVLQDTVRTVAQARKLAKKLRSFYNQCGVRNKGHDIPTVERIRALWGEIPPTEQTPTRELSQRSRRQRRDADSLENLHWTTGGEEELQSSPVDSAEACDRVEQQYAKSLAFFFGKGPVYPVWKDHKNVVFCIPSISCLQNGNLDYDKDGPVFIHIAKKDDSGGQCAVVCSACDTPRGFWPKEHYHGMPIIPQSSGFKSSETSGDTFPMQQCKPLCKCAWALLAVPSRRLWSDPTSENLWEEAMKLCEDHIQWPNFHVNNLDNSVDTSKTVLRKHHDNWLIQVGEFGTEDCAFVKIRTRGSEGKYVVECQTCGRGNRCYHEHIVSQHVAMETSGDAAVKMNRGHTPDTFRKVLSTYADTSGTQSPDSLKLLVKSRKPIPDVPEDDVEPFLRYLPVSSQVFFQLSDKHKYSARQIEWMDYRSPGNLGSFSTGHCASWVPNGTLKDYQQPLPGDVGTTSEGEELSKVAALFHVGGVVAVKIITPFDGNDHAVINVDDRYIFTWELIRKFLTGLRLKPATYSTFVRSMHATWLRCMQQCAELKKMFPSWIDPCSPCKDVMKSLRVAFSRAVHGYVTLLDRDWDNLFKCRCVFQDNTKGSLVYDNACNAVCFILNRDPSFFKKWSVNCDDFHHGGGSTAKGHVNCGPSTKMYNAGTHTPETYFGNMIEQKNSRVKALRDLVCCENQVWMMSTFRYFHAAENILQMVRLQYEKWQVRKTHELTQPRPHALFGVDGTFLPQSARHAFIRRGWEHPEPDCKQRWGNCVQPRNRQMIGQPHHRATLATMLVTTNHCFREFQWTQQHTDFINFLKSERDPVLWLIRLECKNDLVRSRPLSVNAPSQPLWQQQTKEMLSDIKLETSVRFSSVCQIVRNVFSNWAARNPEVQFIFPICAEALRKLVGMDDYTAHDVSTARENSGQHIRSILDFDLHLKGPGYGPHGRRVRDFFFVCLLVLCRYSLTHIVPEAGLLCITNY